MARSSVRRPAQHSPAKVDETAPRPVSHRAFLPYAPSLGPLVRRYPKGQGQLVRHLQTSAGNRAVSVMLQRKGGWPDASTEGPGWNDARAKPVGNIWRIAIAGLTGGAKKAFQGGDSAHSTEAADRRAVVLIPDGFNLVPAGSDAENPVEVLLYFHGHTEAWRGQFAGLRQRTFKSTAATDKANLVSDDQVRDVDLDLIERQIENSGHGRMIGILAQGGPQHQFGNVDMDGYVRDVLTRVQAEYPDKLKKVPADWQVILSGHSGGGTEVRSILDADPQQKKLKAIVLFDAESMAGDIRKRVTADLQFLANLTPKDGDPTAHLADRPRVQVFAREHSKYGKMYAGLVDSTIDKFTAELFPPGQRKELDRLRAQAKLGTRQRARLEQLVKKEKQFQTVNAFLPTVRTHYQITILDPKSVEHEEIIRGTHANSGAYKPGEGNLEKALHSIPG